MVRGRISSTLPSVARTPSLLFDFSCYVFLFPVFFPRSHRLLLVFDTGGCLSPLCPESQSATCYRLPERPALNERGQGTHLRDKVSDVRGFVASALAVPTLCSPICFSPFVLGRGRCSVREGSLFY